MIQNYGCSIKDYDEMMRQIFLLTLIYKVAIQSILSLPMKVRRINVVRDEHVNLKAFANLLVIKKIKNHVITRIKLFFK